MLDPKGSKPCFRWDYISGESSTEWAVFVGNADRINLVVSAGHSQVSLIN